jgi:hypothetical protein
LVESTTRAARGRLLAPLAQGRLDGRREQLPQKRQLAVADHRVPDLHLGLGVREVEAHAAPLDAEDEDVATGEVGVAERAPGELALVGDLRRDDGVAFLEA